ncbi:MAG: hypothetical protein LC130_23855, partial [Bryobacterales bacterium]|nr:hypothetical protein [Bryobacterales bacterium]
MGIDPTVSREAAVAIDQRFLSTLGLSADEWEAYRQSIVGFRNQMVAHHDLNATVRNYPRYDLALAGADFMFSAIRDLADPDSLGGIPSSLVGCAVSPVTLAWLGRQR